MQNGRTCSQSLSERKLLSTPYLKDYRLSELQEHQVASALTSYVMSRLCKWLVVQLSNRCHQKVWSRATNICSCSVPSSQISTDLHDWGTPRPSLVTSSIKVKYKLLIVTFTALRTGTPGYLSDLLVKQTITKRTRSQSTVAPDRLIVPLYSGERSAGASYSVAAPKLWNSLPANIRISRSSLSTNT